MVATTAGEEGAVDVSIIRPSKWPLELGLDSTVVKPLVADTSSEAAQGKPKMST